MVMCSTKIELRLWLHPDVDRVRQDRRVAGVRVDRHSLETAGYAEVLGVGAFTTF